MEAHDVVVIGGGNAALCAALAARDGGARVAVLERAPEAQRGGSSAHAGGAFRVRYDGVDDLRRLMPDLSSEEAQRADFGTYTADRFFSDLMEMSRFRADADLCEKVVGESLPTLQWLCGNGVRFIPIYGRQAYRIDGKFHFFGGLTVEVSGGGLGLMEGLYAAAAKKGVPIRYATRATSLVRAQDGGWRIDCISKGERFTVAARSVILATGGFHANLEWRAKYLGKNWDLAKVRGSRFNTGDGIRMAIDLGAVPHGNWTGCHSVFYDSNAPGFGDLSLLNQQKNYFTLGIVVNAEGRRFIDEGADFRNYTYSDMGAKVLQQTGGVAWQVFDQRTVALLPDEYRVRHATRLVADSLEELAANMEGIDRGRFLQTVGEFNRAVRTEVAFNPAIKDGRAAEGIDPPKSNWANPLDTPPYVAYAVTCGITCTFGGVKVDTRARVVDEDDVPIAGLYAAGEIVGGLYYVKYAGGAGLTAGAVLGKTAGEEAARACRAGERADADR